MGGANAGTLTGGSGIDTLEGGAGVDTVKESGGSFVLTNSSLEGLGWDGRADRGIEAAHLTGGGGNDLLDARVFSGRVRLEGLDGDDTLLGGFGADTLIGGAGNDSLLGGTGIDRGDGNPGLGVELRIMLA